MKKPCAAFDVRLAEMRTIAIKTSVTWFLWVNMLFSSFILGRNYFSAFESEVLFHHPAAVLETMMVKARGQEDRATDKPRPIEPGVPPVGWLGIRIRIDRLWRQRVNLLRQAGRVQRNLPTAIGLLARLTGGLLLLPFNHDLHGELAASPEGHLRRGKCSIGRARRNRADTARQEQRQCGTQKGMRTSISQNETERPSRADAILDA